MTTTLKRQVKASSILRILFCLLIGFPLLLQGQKKDSFSSDLKTEQKPWTNLEFADDPMHFQFAIVSDRTGGPRPGIFEDAVKKLNWLMPEFVITVGDLIRGASGQDTARLNQQWKEHFDRIAPLKMPFFHLAGNHDIKANNPFQIEYWKDMFGATYYSFVYKDVLFLNLFTNEGTQVITDEQVVYFKEVLDKHKEVRWTLVFMHHPLWRYPHMSNFGQIEDLLKDRDYTVFAGHQHRYHHSVRANKNYYVLATTGGGSELLGTSFGTFDHVTWVTVGDDGPIITNLRLDGILPHDVANEETSRLTQDLIRSVHVQKTVLVDSKSSFKEGTAFITYQNKSDYPLFMNARFFHNHHVMATPAQFKEEIAPHSSKTIVVRLESMAPFNLKENVLLEYSGEIGYQLEDYPDLKLNGSVLVPLDKDQYDLLPTLEAEFVDFYLVKMKDPLPGTEIRYTLDGTEPTFHSLKYNSPFEVTSATTVKARLISLDQTKMSAVDQMKLQPIDPGKGLLVKYFEYQQLGRSWSSFSDLAQSAPLKIKATQTLDPVEVAGKNDQFGLVYKGQIALPESGTYRFKAVSDDAIRVLIDGQEVVADPIKHKAREAFGEANLKSGEHSIEIQYFQWKRKYALQLEFVTPSGKVREVNSTILSYDSKSIQN